ncbi:cupin domain-containing protein [Nocardia sp. NPDC050378]|uniref:cupin domain-containing protein n=1 Tax=Nocardia sp. NPDC050378 TaxID=3155400 RepID=UPI0033FCA2E4
MSTIDLFDRALRFRSDGAVTSGERRMAASTDGWQLATFHVETDIDVHADHWEMHPTSDEAVCCVKGTLRLYLRPENTDEPEHVVTLTAGRAFLVPRGRWHRIELDEPCDIMSIGRRDGTRQEPVDR